MRAIKGVLDDLVRRRLWPVALLLIVAAVAAPIVLASKPEVAAPLPAAGAAGTAESQPIASLVEDFSTDARRRVLGAAKDPFKPSGRQPRPARTPSAPSSVGSDAGAGGAGGAGSATSGPGGLGSAPGGTTGGAGGGIGGRTQVGGTAEGKGGPDPAAPGGAPAAPTPTPTPTPTTPKFDLHSLKIRFDGAEQRLKRLEPLPDDENPAIIYLGLLKDEKTAVFLLDESVTTEGDGFCRPSPDDCQRVHLRKGDTQFFDVLPEGGAEGESAEHQLEVLDITVARTKSAATARKAYARSSAAGRRALRSRSARAGRLRYDARTGLLRSALVKEHRASLARAAQTTRAAR